MGKRAYIGQHCIIGPKVNIGDLAVSHGYAVLKSDTKIKPSEIVIRTPTSKLFYQRGARTVSSNEYVHRFYDSKETLQSFQCDFRIFRADIAKSSGQTYDILK